MRDGVVTPEMEQPAVTTASLHPRLERAPRVVGRVGPADEDVREAALGEEPRRVLDDLPRDGVARQAAVAVCIARLRRDHVGRIAGQEVETLALRGLEEAPLPKLDVLHAVQRGVDRGDGERTRIDVRGDHRLGVAGRQQRLDPVPGRDVQRPPDRPSDRELRERHRRRVHPGHPFQAGRALGVTVGRDEEVAVRDELERGPHVAVLLLEPTRLVQRAHRLAVEDRLERGRCNRQSEQEELHELGDGLALGKPPKMDGHVGRRRREPASAEPRLDGIGRKAGLCEPPAQVRERLLVVGPRGDRAQAGDQRGAPVRS
jgi:hypothetical protein